MGDAGVSERFRLYVDESGDHIFRDASCLKTPQHRFLALVGCFFEGHAYVPFHNALEALKQKHVPHNPDDPVILHRSDIVNRRGAFWRLRDPAKRSEFDQDLLSVVGAAEFSVIVVVVDKLKLKLNHGDPFHPYHTALDFLLQRYCSMLNHLNRTGDVVAESRGGREDRLLRNAYVHIFVHGDMHHKAAFYQQVLTSRNLKLKTKSANLSGLQLVDLLAHPLKQQLLVDHGLLPDPGDTFGKRLAAMASDKYNRSVWTREVEGYGRVLFPK